MCFRFSVAAQVLMLLMPGWLVPAVAVEIAVPEAKGYGSREIAVAPLPDGGFRITGGPTAKKITYASLRIPCNVSVDAADFSALEVTASADRKIRIKPELQLETGRTAADYDRGRPLEELPRVIRFERNAFAPALSGRVRELILGFGLWEFDTTKQGFEIEIKGVNLLLPEERFLIPRPTAGVEIDGAYRKDWGFEDNLYFWHPPVWVKLDRPSQLVEAKQWRSAEELSGRFSFMYNETTLFFLAEVADATPGGGTHSDAPWENDSIELFLAPGVLDSELRRGAPLQACGVQIVFDCGAGGGKAMIPGGKADSIRSRLIRGNVTVNGNPVPGYVLEAAIPAKLLRGWKPVRGDRLAWSLSLRDSGGTRFSVTPQNPAPHQNISGFRSAYLDFFDEKSRPAVTWGAVAVDFPFPKELNAPERRLWEKSELRLISATAERFYLNGIWAIQCVPDREASPNPAKWLYAPLPMGIGWAMPLWRPVPGRGLVPVPEGYAALGGTKGRFFWYERTFSVPENWRTRHLRLRCDYLDIEAECFLNGEYLGSFTLEQPELPVDPARLRHGEPNRLSLRLFTRVNPSFSAANGKCGITGDLYLESSESAPPIRDLWVKQASGLTGEFDVQLELVRGTGLSYEAEADILDSAGISRCRMARRPAAERFSFTGKVADFRPWSPESPTLFTFRLRLYSRGRLVEERLQKFGFRTFETKGAHFLLNGKIFRFRTGMLTNPSKVIEPGRFRQLRKFGFNAIYFHANEYGNNFPIFDLLDREGFVVIAPFDRAAPDGETAELVRRTRNHPSVVGYLSDQYGQLDINGYIHDPFRTDDSYLPSGERAQTIFRLMTRRDELFRRLDPSRRYVAQATGNWPGFMRITHQYATNGLNLSDRRRYQEPWAARKNPQLPLYIFEAGVSNLLNFDTTHPDHTFEVLPQREPVERLMNYECAARYLGDRAFSDWRQWEWLLMRESLRNFRLHGVDGFCMWIADDLWAHPVNTDSPRGFPDRRRLDPRFFTSPVGEVLEDGWMRVNSGYYRLRAHAAESWPERYGLGVLQPKTTRFTPLFLNEMQPFFVCIGNEADDPAGYDHNYYGGEMLKKQLLGVNDTSGEFRFRGTVTLQVAGRTVARRKFDQRIAQGARFALPFEFRLPEPGEPRVPAELQLEFFDDRNSLRKESFALTIFRRAEYGLEPGTLPVSTGRFRLGVVAVEKLPVTHRLGLAAETLTLDRPIPAEISHLVIERNTFADPARDVLESFLLRGGQLLVLEQSGGLFGHRLKELYLEHLFATDTGHPVLEGLCDADLAMWRGRAGTVPAEKRPPDSFRHSQSAALETPHLTNRNVVAGKVLPLPSAGAFQPILTGGFDRGEAALLEAASGAGRAIFCQVDLTDRLGIDPAATRLARNLFRYFLTSKPSESLPGVRYFGGPKGRAFLSRLGISVVPASPVAVAGEDATGLDTLPAEVRTLVVLPMCDVLPGGITAKPIRIRTVDSPLWLFKSLYGTSMFRGERPGADSDVPRDFAGITTADLYCFENPEVKSFSAAGAERSRYGTLLARDAGSVRQLFCAWDPASVRSTECRRKIDRIWSILFFRLGVKNRRMLNFSIPPWDLSGGEWHFLTDPDGSGEQRGYATGNFGGRVPRPIEIGKVWEEQGVTETNPAFNSAPGSAYDGFGWYFRTAMLPEIPKGKVYLYIGGIRDIFTFRREEQRSTLFINGRKMPEPVYVSNAHRGGRGARLWQLPEGVLRPGRNFIAVRVYNDYGPGGIHAGPVLLEFPGFNSDVPFAREFDPVKYTNYFFWCW